MTRKVFISIATAISAAVGACPPAGAQDAAPASETAKAAKTVVPADVEWGPLNAARGGASPRAGNLWGDRMTPGASGFLVRFDDGFASPPHIHNVTYRGLVIEGLVHNDDPAAANMWLPTGSFWTQPAGKSHITAAKGISNLAYIEIQEGPYLVKPADEAFDNGERPINAHRSNLVWLDATDIDWFKIPDSAETAEPGSFPQMAFLWGRPQQGELSGTLVKLPAGFTGEIRGNNSPLRAVVIQGEINHRLDGENEVKTLPPGSYFGSTDVTVHSITNMTEETTIIYIRTSGPFTIG